MSGGDLNQDGFDIGLLPRFAERFFGLETGYDMRTLKRSYGKAIRRFRPETHPSEFQLVRAAYESLERALRYGRAPSNEGTVVWESPLQGDAVADRASQAEPRADRRTSALAGEPLAPKPTLLQIAVADPVAAMAELKNKPKWQPPDFVLAGLLSDATPTPKRHGFLVWLLRGLKQHPHDRTLYSLIADYLDHDIADREITAVVQFVAKTLRSDDFYPLTESLWLRQFRLRPAADVIAELSDCEACVLSRSPLHGIIFDLRVLSVAAWTSDLEWVRGRMAMMKHGTLDFPDYMESDYQVLDALLRYIETYRIHPDHTFRTPEEQKLHQLISGCSGTATPAVRNQAIAYLLELSSDSERLRDQLAIDLESNLADRFHDTRLLFGALPYVTERLADEAGLPGRQRGNRSRVGEPVNCRVFLRPRSFD